MSKHIELQKLDDLRELAEKHKSPLMAAMNIKSMMEINISSAQCSNQQRHGGLIHRGNNSFSMPEILFLDVFLHWLDFLSFN